MGAVMAVVVAVCTILVGVPCIALWAFAMHDTMVGRQRRQMLAIEAIHAYAKHCDDAERERREELARRRAESDKLMQELQYAIRLKAPEGGERG